MSDIRTALENALSEDTLEIKEPVEQVEKVEETEQPVEQTQEPEVKQEKPRDEQGKFAPKQEEKIPDAPKPERKAPSTWKQEAQAAFLKADRGEPLTNDEIKILISEAERRENDARKDFFSLKDYRDKAQKYDSAFAPYRDHIKSLGVDEITAINALMRTDQTLRNADPWTKKDMFMRLAQEYGIDLYQQLPQLEPAQQYMMQELKRLQNQQQVPYNVPAQNSNVAETIQEFSADKPHFDAVRDTMADLLEQGKAKDLAEAYETAIWLNPEIRQNLIEQQYAERTRKAQEQAQTQKARNAAVSVKSSNPSAGGLPTNSSIRDVLAHHLS